VAKWFIGLLIGWGIANYILEKDYMFYLLLAIVFFCETTLTNQRLDRASWFNEGH